MAVSTIPCNIVDETDKLRFEALYKRAIKIGNMVYFWAECYFPSYVANYGYKLDIDSSLIPSTGIFPLSAVMVDGSFNPQQEITAFVSNTGLNFRASAYKGNYMIISGTWYMN